MKRTPRHSAVFAPFALATALALGLSNGLRAAAVDVSAAERVKPALPKVPAIRNILIDHVTIEGSRNAGLIHGIPDSPITNITLSDITLTAEKDFDIRDAEAPVFERVIRTIKAGVAPPRISGEH